MIGILSILEKVYDIPMGEVVRNLNLSEDVSAALISRQGGLGKLLYVAEMVEEMKFDQLTGPLEEMGISIEDVLTSQKRAYTWRKGMA